MSASRVHLQGGRGGARTPRVWGYWLGLFTLGTSPWACGGEEAGTPAASAGTGAIPNAGANVGANAAAAPSTAGGEGSAGGRGGQSGGGVVAVGGVPGSGGVDMAGAETGGSEMGGAPAVLAGAGGVAAEGGAGGSAAEGGAGGEEDLPPVCKPITPLNGSGLTLSAPDISAFRYAVPPAADLIKMAYDPIGQVIVLLRGNGDMYSLNPNLPLPATASTSPVTATAPYVSGYAPESGFGGGFAGHRGIAFGPDGSLYVLALRGGANVGASIRKGAPAAAGQPRTWTTIVTTGTGFSASGTDFDHSFSGIAVSPDGTNLFIGSGSRTDHGEVRGALREAPLSSCILKLPTSGLTTLSNDDLVLGPLRFARGMRNPFDLAFNAAGDLIGTDNGPDMDLPDEVNFIEEGKHYGFPWRFGGTDNPTRDPSYNRTGDTRLHAGYGAVTSYAADATFPAPPAGGFTDPITNLGPHANWHRVDGNAVSPTQAAALPGITGHRSPLGLAFDNAGALCGDYYKQGFLLSYGALLPGALNDPGEDLLLLRMTKNGGAYTMTAQELAKGIKAPMDSLLVGSRLFTIAFGNAAQIYVFLLPTP